MDFISNSLFSDKTKTAVYPTAALNVLKRS